MERGLVGRGGDCHKGEFAPAMRRELDPEADRTNRIKRPSQRSAERLPFPPGRPGGAAVAAEESPAIGFHAKAREAIVLADHPMEHDRRFLGGKWEERRGGTSD